MRSDLQQELAEAFDTDLADALTPFSCTRIIRSGKLNPATEQYEHQETVQYGGRCILGNYLRDLVKPNDYQVTDTKALVLQNEISAEPKIKDEWLMGIDIYRVINVSKDPVSATWSCQLRRA